MIIDIIVDDAETEPIMTTVRAALTARAPSITQLVGFALRITNGGSDKYLFLLIAVNNGTIAEIALSPNVFYALPIPACTPDELDISAIPALSSGSGFNICITLEGS
jgi:hypothetical protein